MSRLHVGDLAPGQEPDLDHQKRAATDPAGHGADGASGPPAPTLGSAVPDGDLHRADLHGADTYDGDTYGADADSADTDMLAPFAPAIMAVRWATTGVSLALASPALLAGDRVLAAWLALILINTVFRTFSPLRYSRSLLSIVLLVGEIGFHVLAVVATGYWDSPIVLGLINAVIIAGFARGFGFALRVGATSTLAVALPGIGAGLDGPLLAQSAQWATLIGLSGVVAGYSRRISGEASRRYSLTLDRVARLADANALLSSLHRVTQTLPASLDLGDVLDTTLSRLRSLLDHDTAVILVRDHTERSWQVARQSGAGLVAEIDDDALPPPARQAVAEARTVLVDDLASGHRATAGGNSWTNCAGFGARSMSGLYLPLMARNRLIGLLAVESSEPDTFGPRERELLEGFGEPAALAIDNARWFKRIRTVGADEERNRIARDLHDRIGQSLAYLGFEVDRLIRLDDAGHDVGEGLVTLRSELRGLVGEMRDTLSDLRTDVSDNRDFAQTAQEYIERITRRSGLTIELDVTATRRLPLLQEREMWRITQEALTNVERHAEATTALVRWCCDEQGALLEVIDDGKGLPTGQSQSRPGRTDSYGIVGMRERADSVGATFEMTSEPGEGTKVRCFLAQM